MPSPDTLDYTPAGWPYLTEGHYMDLIDDYTAALADKLENSDADVAAAINASTQASAAAAQAEAAAAQAAAATAPGPWRDDVAWLNGWQTYTGSYLFRWRQTPIGVQLSGLITGGTTNAAIFTLPVGPTQRIVTAALCYSGSYGYQMRRLDALPGGTVTVEHGDATWIALDNIIIPT